MGGEGGWEGREGGREGRWEGREGGREGGRPVWRNHHLLSLPSLSHPKAWQLYCQERACLPKAVTLPSQKPEGFTLRKKKKARVLRRVEWLPFYEKKNKKIKKTKSKSPRFLRCVKQKGPSFTPCRMASILRGEKKKKKKKKKTKSKSPRFLRCVKKGPEFYAVSNGFHFTRGKKKKKKKKKKNKSKSPRFLRCVKKRYKGPSFTPCRMASILRKKPKKKKN